MNARLLGAAMLALVAVTSSCKRDHRDDLPSQTTTTGASVPVAEGCLERCDGGTSATRTTNAAGGGMSGESPSSSHE